VRTTVLVPLHGSARWLPVVTGTIERLAPHAQLLVSDATGVDDTLARLRERFGHLENVEWVGPRPLPAGWVAHCNDLLERARTEYVMWMPHDDETHPAWVTLGERALDDSPGAVLALGRLQSLEQNELGVDDRSVPSRVTYDPHPPFLDSDAEKRVGEALRLCFRGPGSLLGMAFRGVFRRESAVPLPDTGPDGAWADILWAIRMLGVGSFTSTEAAYWKRWYDGSTHDRWARRGTDPLFRTEYLPVAVSPLDPAARMRVLMAAWAEDASVYEERITRMAARREAAARAARDRLAASQARVRELRGELRRSQARTRSVRQRLRAAEAATAAQRRDYEESTSWRLTAPLRRAGSLLRGRGTQGAGPHSSTAVWAPTGAAR
jgi:hypothetical protein